jgi:hypothetical protein
MWLDALAGSSYAEPPSKAQALAGLVMWKAIKSPQRTAEMMGSFAAAVAMFWCADGIEFPGVRQYMVSVLGTDDDEDYLRSGDAWQCAQYWWYFPSSFQSKLSFKLNSFRN